MPNGQRQLPADVTFTPPKPDMSDVTFTPPQQTDKVFTPGPENFGSITGDIALGALKGVGQTVSGVAQGLREAGEAATPTPMVPRGAGDIIPVSGTKALDQISTPTNAPQEIGAGLEGLGEFILADMGIAGIPEEALALMEKYPKAAKLVTEFQKAKKAAEESKLATKAIDVARTGAVGAGQGAVKGAPEGRSLEEAEAGAIGGAAAETASSIAGALTKEFAKTAGIGTTAVQDATRGAKPRKSNLRFAQDFLTAAPYMDQAAQVSKPETVEQWADATADARHNMWANEIQPIIDKHQAVPLSGIAIRNQISAQIPESMKKFNPEQAAEVERFANEFMPGQKFALNVKDAESDLEYFNAKLASTGYWTKTAPERAALLKTNPDAIMAKAGGDAIRDELYNRLGILEPGVDIGALKNKYGALRNVENEIRGQINVAGRQAPLSLKQVIGTSAGLMGGGWRGVAAAGLPFADRTFNAPENLISRGVRKAVGKESTMEKVAEGTGKVLGTAAPAVGATTGEKIEASRPRPEGNRFVFRASDGSIHSVPNDQDSIEKARAIDPQLEPLK